MAGLCFGAKGPTKKFDAVKALQGLIEAVTYHGRFPGRRIYELMDDGGNIRRDRVTMYMHPAMWKGLFGNKASVSKQEFQNQFKRFCHRLDPRDWKQEYEKLLQKVTTYSNGARTDAVMDAHLRDGVLERKEFATIADARIWQEIFGEQKALAKAKFMRGAEQYFKKKATDEFMQANWRSLVFSYVKSVNPDFKHGDVRGMTIEIVLRDGILTRDEFSVLPLGPRNPNGAFRVFGKRGEDLHETNFVTKAQFIEKVRDLLDPELAKDRPR